LISQYAGAGALCLTTISTRELAFIEPSGSTTVYFLVHVQNTTNKHYHKKHDGDVFFELTFESHWKVVWIEQGNYLPVR